MNKQAQTSTVKFLFARGRDEENIKEAANQYCMMTPCRRVKLKLMPSFSIGKILSVLEKYGRAPLPPYINSSPLSKKEQRAEYQTVFAKTAGSIAAPTASLHFTKSLLKKLEANGKTSCDM